MTSENTGAGTGHAPLTLVQLERQVERGSLFTHTALSDNAERIHEAESFLYGLVDVLVAKGVATPKEIQEAAGKVRREMDAGGETLGPGVALRVDGTAQVEQGFVAVNCAERMHVCKAICCKLTFALTAEEVEAGRVKWDLGQPYFIRQDASGFCTHNDRARGCCTVYEDRPAICRYYSCAKDTRIWKDFEKMELNEEWLNEHFAGESRPLLTRALMMRTEAVAPPRDESAEGQDAGTFDSAKGLD